MPGCRVAPRWLRHAPFSVTVGDIAQRSESPRCQKCTKQARELMATSSQFSAFVLAVWYGSNVAFDDPEEGGHVPFPHRQHSTTGARGHHPQDASTGENAFGVNPVVERRGDPVVGDA
jgi:hypothetical protein